MTTKLTPSQITALQFLSREPWVAAWWGGKPHSGWPKELNGRTFDKLHSIGFVTMRNAGDRFDRAVMITDAGSKALNGATELAP